jgi:hypothetical protein
VRLAYHLIRRASNGARVGCYKEERDGSARLVTDMGREVPARLGQGDSQVECLIVSAVWGQLQAALPSHFIAPHKQFLAKGALDVRY